uniref:CSON003576 protein n=1 Tax=Culicoides sonorensis TaxID=179676 RepID=A0A336MZL8_CULSO
MRNLYVAITVFMVIINNNHYYTEAGVIRKKRSLFREQVSPHLPGGKIPETAFNADRLILNRLQSDGIAVPDGIILEPRPYQVYPYEHRNVRETYKVQIQHGGHYIAMPLADSTYLVPKPLHYDIKWVPSFKPLLAYVQFPTHDKQKPAQFITKPPQAPPRYHSTSSFTYPTSVHTPHPANSFGKTRTYLSWTITPEMEKLRWPGTQDYGSEQVFGDLDSFFTTYGARVLRHTESQGKKKIQQNVPKSKQVK